MTHVPRRPASQDQEGGAIQPATYALEAVGLRKAFGGLNVTQDVSLNLAPGARHALIGPNGAGKSTLIALLSGVLRPDAGTVRMYGQDVTHKNLAQRVKCGLVRTFQVSSLFSGLTALENVYLAVSECAMRSWRPWSPAKADKAVLERSEAILCTVGLQDVQRRTIGELAYGQQRLVEIAIALALKPKVLLLDEPGAGIPSAQSNLLLRALDRLPPEIAILLIEHDMQLVRRFASEVTVLVEGSILLSGSPDEVMKSSEVRTVYLGSKRTERFEEERAHA
ncbi:branched-chain amino acid transport system ATP-binding protein [Pusillimonas noertemannii]|uniref:Branched-chain amino acid transport system ATP-binding protein n=1 Tax=Pusillimonas noertemannii TaxID=305977 RepID=A0A2U1CNX0_9BURK|nr:ABC transporter ATP-binding protein [Pusillimonas noertemannii]NYT68277.1 ABC transporter ATP-binding protein [Pusillimonas noertemannii]PVY62708.1 branched-chain amino acid transport system ATP-binding protein [Pusillimonas noertemannii]TFL10354.1 ABC transporter ATP-binding protein [Pusillimonas noertemannii]